MNKALSNNRPENQTQFLEQRDSGDSRALHSAIAFICENYSADLDLNDLALASGVSKFSLSRRLKKKFDMSPMQFLWVFRTLLASEFLKEFVKMNLTDIAFACGFGSSAHFSRTFCRLFSVPPSKYRKMHKSEHMYSNEETLSVYNQPIKFIQNVLRKIEFNTNV